jgi:hypothetical protein
MNDLVTIKNAGLQTANAGATQCAVTSNVVTITSTNTFKGVEYIWTNGFTGACSFLNGRVLNLASGTTTSSYFTAPFTHTDVTTVNDSATYTQTKDLSGTIVSIGPGAKFTVNFTPGNTVTGNSGVAIWASANNQAAIAATFAAAATYCNNSTGHCEPQIFFGQGEYHLNSQIHYQRGNLSGYPGTGGTFLYWDGNTSTSMFYKSSTDDGNETISGIRRDSTNWNQVPLDRGTDRRKRELIIAIHLRSTWQHDANGSGQYERLPIRRASE